MLLTVYEYAVLFISRQHKPLKKGFCVCRNLEQISHIGIYCDIVGNNDTTGYNISMAGRRTKHTGTTEELLVKAIELGATIELACSYAGIDPSTFYDWLKDPQKIEFSKTIERAKGQGAVEILERIQKAATNGAWQADAWLLERRYPHMYGRTVQEHDGSIKVIVERKNRADTPHP